MALLEARGLAARFGGVVALGGVDLRVEEGGIHGLIGPNGAGKTTLINVISGLFPPSSGSLVFAGRGGGPWPIAEAVHRGIVRTFQQTRAFLGLSVRENLRIAALAARAGHDLDALIDACDLEGALERTAQDLPYATLRRLGIALALALRPKLLLLDEPAVGLTAPEVERLGQLVRRWNREGTTVLLVEHNVRFLMALSDRVSVMDRGRLLFEGTPAECQGRREVIDVYLGRSSVHAEG